jgi:hypothetical protein
VLARLVERCRAQKVTVTAALSAAMLLTASDFAHAADDTDYHLYRFLLSLNMRQFPANQTRVRGGSVGIYGGYFLCVV